MPPPPRNLRYSYTPLRGFWGAGQNVLTDGSHTYAWDADGNSISLDTVGLTFDALDRMVEQNRSGTYTEIVYSPSGAKLALMSGSGGQTLQKAFVPLPGQATAVYTSSGLDHYRHSDWLGSARLTSSTTRTVLSTAAYAPFGETYAQSGTADLSLTGMNQDTTSGDNDFLYREYSTQGRWPSPDPSGINAVNPSHPQSWNRYAYVLNNPLALTDPLGLDCIYGYYVNGAVGEYAADSGVYVVPGDCVSEDDDGLYVPGSVVNASLDSAGNLSYQYTYLNDDGNLILSPDPSTIGGFAGWDWPDTSLQGSIASQMANPAFCPSCAPIGNGALNMVYVGTGVVVVEAAPVVAVLAGPVVVPIVQNVNEVVTVAGEVYVGWQNIYQFTQGLVNKMPPSTLPGAIGGEVQFWVKKGLGLN
jgi:RHS repeat-associated protein